MPVARHTAVKDARAEMRQMQRRMTALARNRSALRDLTEVAESVVSDRLIDAAWPTAIAELADKIDREHYSLLAASESRVTAADRQLILKSLPPCIEVAR